MLRTAYWAFGNATRLTPLLAALFCFWQFSRVQAAVPRSGADDDPTKQTDADWVDDRWNKSDIGRFLATAIDLPGDKTVKAIAVKLGEREEASICFDTELLRYSAGWSGGFVQFSSKRYGLLDAPRPRGAIEFKSRKGPGWAYQGRFSDPRTNRMGNLPRAWGHYTGMYQSGNRVVFAYRIGSVEVLDSPSLLRVDDDVAFTRTFEVGATEAPLEAQLCDLPSATVTELDGVRFLVSGGETNVTAVTLLGANMPLTNGASAQITFPSSTGSAVAAAIIWHGSRNGLGKLAQIVKQMKPADGLRSLTKGGRANWNQPVVTRGTPGLGAGPFAIDTLTVPYQNPWKALMFTSGHDFFENGNAAICTVHGDVWVVSGIDAKLEKLNWKRFATGLYQPLGLKIIRDQVHVICRDGIVVLHDQNGDGEADYYQNFNNDCLSTGGGHSYASCLETDAAGNFYFVKCGENTPHGGTILKVSADGQKLDVVATGFRNPNGLGIGPNDLITVADQQGEWVPETRVDLIRPGGFYGYMPMHKRAQAPKTFDGPLCWIARTVDNSAGGEVWVPANHWGALGGKMLHLSYGRCTMMLLLCDGEREPVQAAAVPLPGRFLSGVMRGRFNSRDGNLYVSGLRGWQTAAVQDGCFQRVRFNPREFRSPVGYAVRKNGIELTFPQALDAATAQNVDSYDVERWNYKWSSTYGSPDFSVTDPSKQGRDSVRISKATLSADQRSVLFEIADLRPAHQMKIRYNLKTADGKPIRSETYATINQVPKS